MDIAKQIQFFDTLKERIDPAKEPGFCAAIVCNGDVGYQINHGLASMEHAAPLTNQSLFYLASVSKQFTAASILHLVNDKKLRLNQDARELVKELKHCREEITIQQLLNHTSGIPDYFEYLNTQLHMHWRDYFDNDNILKIVEKLYGELRFEPGARFDYSNTNYILLADIIKTVSKTRTSAYTKKMIFKPTGMKHSLFDDNREKVVINRVASYNPKKVGSKTYECYLKNSCTVGDGGVLSSIDDLVKWETNFHKNKVLPASVIRGLTKRGKLASGESIDYGNGLELPDKNSKLNFSYHGGSFEGFITYVLREPATKSSLIYLSNNEYLFNGVQFPHRTNNLVARFM